MRTLNRTEFLIIALLIIVLLAVGLPWLLSSRQVSRLEMCRNKQRLIGEAIGNHIKLNTGRFPPATFGSETLPPDKRLAWTVPIALLRHPEGTKSTFEPAVPWDEEPNLTPEIGGESVLRYPLFHCPDDPIDAPPGKLQFSSYVGMAGVGKDAPTLPAVAPAAGIFGFDRRTTLATLGENSEHTICILETSLDNGPWTAAGPPTLRPFLPDETPFIGRGLQFGGFHSVGAVTLMADLRVRVFSPNTDAGVFARLCTIGMK